jgi:hypothetical protein
MLFVADKTGKVVYSDTGYEMTLEIMLAQQLNIKNYSPTAGGGK